MPLPKTISPEEALQHLTETVPSSKVLESTAFSIIVVGLSKKRDQNGLQRFYYGIYRLKATRWNPNPYIRQHFKDETDYMTSRVRYEPGTEIPKVTMEDRKILKDPNATPEQKEKAQKKIDEYLRNMYGVPYVLYGEPTTLDPSRLRQFQIAFPEYKKDFDPEKSPSEEFIRKPAIQHVVVSKRPLGNYGWSELEEEGEGDLKKHIGKEEAINRVTSSLRNAFWMIKPPVDSPTFWSAGETIHQRLMEKLGIQIETASHKDRVVKGERIKGDDWTDMELIKIAVVDPVGIAQNFNSIEEVMQLMNQEEETLSKAATLIGNSMTITAEQVQTLISASNIIDEYVPALADAIDHLLVHAAPNRTKFTTKAQLAQALVRVADEFDSKGEYKQAEMADKILSQLDNNKDVFTHSDILDNIPEAELE